MGLDTLLILHFVFEGSRTRSDPRWLPCRVFSFVFRVACRSCARFLSLLVHSQSEGGELCTGATPSRLGGRLPRGTPELAF